MGTNTLKTFSTKLTYRRAIVCSKKVFDVQFELPVDVAQVGRKIVSQSVLAKKFWNIGPRKKLQDLAHGHKWDHSPPTSQLQIGGTKNRI